MPERKIVPTQTLAKIATVAISGGDYASPLDAMANVSAGDTWCGNPSASNPCLVKIAPGVYTEPSAVFLKSFVDVEGSGQDITVIM